MAIKPPLNRAINGLTTNSVNWSTGSSLDPFILWPNAPNQIGPQAQQAKVHAGSLLDLMHCNLLWVNGHYKLPSSDFDVGMGEMRI